MPRLADYLRSQIANTLSLIDAFVRLAGFCLLLVTLSGPSPAQNTKGLPEVGNGSAPASSQIFIDATQFLVTDMCDAINTACSKLNASSTTYPAGATIDARGFTGNQVCKATNITTMLYQCSPAGSSNGSIGGKLLLGNVNLYADGPSGGVNGHYTDALGSGIGTPAVIIPDSFWGIEGISRGALGVK